MLPADFTYACKHLVRESHDLYCGSWMGVYALFAWIPSYAAYIQTHLHANTCTAIC